MSEWENGRVSERLAHQPPPGEATNETEQGISQEDCSQLSEKRPSRMVGIVWFGDDNCMLSPQHTTCQPFTPRFEWPPKSIYVLQ